MKIKICSVAVLIFGTFLLWHPSMAIAADVSPCNVESLYFAQCLHDHAQSMVRQDINNPPAERAYAIRLDDTQGRHWSATVLMPGAEAVPVAGTLGGVHFALSTLSVDNAATTVAIHVDGASDRGTQFRPGDERTVNLADGRMFTITRL